MSKSNNKSLVDFTGIHLREILDRAGLNNQSIERFTADYERFRQRDPSSLSALTYKDLQSLSSEAFTAERNRLRDEEEAVDPILLGYLRYIGYKNKIAETYQESKDWELVFSTGVYQDGNESQESFVDYVEETYKTRVKDIKHLQKLTGITPDKEAAEDTTGELEELIIKSRYSKYFRSLEIALRAGAKYKDLLKIKPKDYGLPNDWSGCLSSDQYSSILWAISFEFSIAEPLGLMMYPDLRSIAVELEAPYSVLIDCHKLTNRGGGSKRVYREIKMAAFNEKLRKALRAHIKKQPEDWKRDRLLTPFEGGDKNNVIRQMREYEDWFIMGFNSVVVEDIREITQRPGGVEDELIKGIKEAWRAEYYEEFKKYIKEAVEITIKTFAQTGTIII